MSAYLTPRSVGRKNLIRIYNIKTTLSNSSELAFFEVLTQICGATCSLKIRKHHIGCFVGSVLSAIPYLVDLQIGRQKHKIASDEGAQAQEEVFGKMLQPNDGVKDVIRKCGGWITGNIHFGTV